MRIYTSRERRCKGHGVIVKNTAGWAAEARHLCPGTYVISFGNDGIEGRRAGLELRDSILVAGPDGIQVALLFRVPITESTVAAQVLQTGTGVLNLDACRIGWQGADDLALAKPGSRPKAHDGFSGKSFKMRDRSTEDPANHQHAAGRWPTNFVLIHKPECRHLGKHVVPAISHAVGVSPAWYPEKGRDSYGAFAGHRPTSFVEGGKEAIDAWECVPTCLVDALDDQSGNRPGAYRSDILALAKMREQKECHGLHTTYGKGLDTKPAGTLYTDSGGASRFYAQLRDEAELIEWIVRLTSV